jgi:dihydroflavonol-4-reductase
MLMEEIREVNLGGATRVLDMASAKGVPRVVVASSALAVGVNRQPQPLDENASWAEHAFNLPYAVLRRQAEQESLARARPGFDVLAVCPAFTMGPDDPVGAPANKLLKSLINRKMPITLTVGFGCLDVRDFASGVLLAARRGRSGQRYLLSGHNVTTKQFVEEVASIAGIRPPRFEPPKVVLGALVSALALVSRLRGRPAPLTRDVLQIIGRYAWYDTSRARAELGWTPRPLGQTLEDTIRWLREPQQRRQ